MLVKLTYFDYDFVRRNRACRECDGKKRIQCDDGNGQMMWTSCPVCNEGAFTFLAPKDEDENP